MLPERRARLDALGFIWDIDDAFWEKMFAALVQFKLQRRHCNVPQSFSENPQLGVWVNNLRRRSKTLPPKRKARLDALGFEWSRTD